MEKMSETFLFYLGHPAHYHNISVATKILESKGFKVVMVARDKDILFDLVEDKGDDVIYLKPKRGKGKLSMIINVLKREIQLQRVATEYQPCLMVGTDIVIAHVGKRLNIPTYILNEDDAAAVPLLAKYGFKYATGVISPNCCDITPFEDKKIGYEGYHELAYLHPNYFKPDARLIKELTYDPSPYFILRFAELTAHHDVGRQGIDLSIAQQLIKQLESHGRVYISAERKLERELEQYRIKIHPRLMHHALYYASMYIGDSQTMAAEAGVLGTPSIRFNDFVGELGYLEELEHKYRLTYGFKTSESKRMYDKIKYLLSQNNLKEQWEIRRQNMLSDKIDVTSFFVWLIENYPESLTTLKSNPGIQNKFK